MYFTLLSNASLSEYPYNTLSFFKCDLPQHFTSEKRVYIKINSIYYWHELDSQNHPAHLKIHIIEATPQIDTRENRNFGKCVATLPFIKRKSSHGTFYEIIDSVPFMLNSNFIDSLTVLLTDERNRQLRLTIGQPTVLNIELLEDMEDQFTITCDIVSNNEYFPSNKFSSFKVKLPQQLNINEDWEVALSSISLPSKIKTVFDEPPIFSFNESNKTFNLFSYNSNNDLRNDLEEFLSKESKEYVKTLPEEKRKIFQRNLVRFYDLYKQEEGGNTHIARMHDGDVHNDLKVNIKMNKTAQHLFGSEDFDVNMTPFSAIKLNMDLTRLIPEILLLYCDIIKENPIGNITAPLLHMIPSKKKKNGSHAHIFKPKNLVFHPLKMSNIQKIEFKLTNTAGYDVESESSNQCNITLLFRKKFLL